MHAKATLHPHRKLKLSVGDICIDSRKPKLDTNKHIHKPQASDPFLSYKESCISQLIFRSDPLKPAQRSLSHDRHQTSPPLS